MNVLGSAHLLCLVWPGQLTKGKKSPLSFGDGPSDVSLGMPVTFACMCALNKRGGISDVHAAGRTPPPPELHPQIHRQMQRPARKNTNTTTKTKRGRNNTQIQQNTTDNTHIQKKKRVKSKYTRKYKPRGRSGQTHEGCFFLHAGLFV